MTEQIILGIIQGITEWLPISSEGAIVLVKTNIVHTGESLEALILQALQLHLGTFLAALLYFHREVRDVLTTLIRFKTQPKGQQRLFSFLFISTVLSGIVGFVLLKAFSHFSSQFSNQGKIVTIGIGILLLGTAYLELKAKKSGYRTLEDITTADSFLLGFVQGLAALPGLSRSGLTVSMLLLRKFDKNCALKLSFLMSLPIVLGGNIILNASLLGWSREILAGVFFAFIFGLATIHLLLWIAHKINFGYFVLFFGILTILSAVI